MEMMQLAQLLGDGSFGGGFGAGMGSGMAVGIAVGMSTATGAAKKKLESQLAAAIESSEISVSDKNGNPMTADGLIQLIQTQSAGK